jgi:type VI protein secretion system component VasK
LKAERLQQDKKPAGSRALKRKADQMSEADAGASSPEDGAADDGVADDQAPLTELLSQFLKQATGQPQVTPPAPPCSAKDLEKARVKAAKEAAKRAKEEAAKQKKEAAKDQKDAERVLALAAKATAGLNPVSSELNETHIPDNTPEVLETALNDLKAHVDEMLKSAQAIITASRKKGFVNSKPTLDFDGKAMIQAVRESKAIIKKLQGFGKLMDS